MDLRRAAAILSMAMVPGLCADHANDQALEILLRNSRFVRPESEIAKLVEQIIELAQDGKVPRPVAVMQLASDQDVRVGPSVHFGIVGRASESQVVCVWRVFWGWAFVSEEGEESYAGWVPETALAACQDC